MLKLSNSFFAFESDSIIYRKTDSLIGQSEYHL